jgi:hypothetical protein
MWSDVPLRAGPRWAGGPGPGTWVGGVARAREASSWRTP